MTEEHLNILKSYLSDDEIKELIISEYKQIIHEELKRVNVTKHQSEFERVISNSVYYYIEQLIDDSFKIDLSSYINDKVSQVIKNPNIEYHIFRKKSAWEKEDSPGQILLDKAIIDNKEIINQKVVEAINKVDVDLLHDSLYELVGEIIKTKLKA